jgi:hypothetical protein
VIVVKGVEAIVVLHPMFAIEILQLGEGGCVSQKEVYI